MITLDLTGIEAKISRCDELCAALKAELDSFISQTCRIEGRYLEAPSRYTFYAYGPSALPQRFAVLAGEIVHHLRSALDHSVTQLSARGPGGGNPNVLEFPICRNADAFSSSVERGKLRGVAEPTIRAIEALQPYNSSRVLDESPLLCLHDLNRADKHRLLPVVVAAVMMGDRMEVDSACDVEIAGMSPPLCAGTRPSDDGKEIFSISFGQKSDPAIKIASNFGFAAVLERVGAIEDVPLHGALRTMRDSVVRALATLFPDVVTVS